MLNNDYTTWQLNQLIRGRKIKEDTLKCKLISPVFLQQHGLLSFNYSSIPKICVGFSYSITNLSIYRFSVIKILKNIHMGHILVFYFELWILEVNYTCESPSRIKGWFGLCLWIKVDNPTNAFWKGVLSNERSWHVNSRFGVCVSIFASCKSFNTFNTSSL